MRLTRFVEVVVCGSLLSPIAAAFPARAQRPCPERPPEAAAPSDPERRADQALCWYELQRSRSPVCSSGADCLGEAAWWCDGAAIDQFPDSSVIDACFAGRIHQGQFDQAELLARRVSRAPELTSCRLAFTRGLDVRVESEPPGARVEVAGRSAGSAPVVAYLS